MGITAAIKTITVRLTADVYWEHSVCHMLFKCFTWVSWLNIHFLELQVLLL